MSGNAGLRTSAALALVGVDAKCWQNARDRHGHFCDGPKGQHRIFGVDDLVVLTIFKILLEIGCRPVVAGRIASEVSKILSRRSRIENIFLVAGVDRETGRPSARVVETLTPADAELHRFRIAVYRRQAAIDLAGALEARDDDE